MQKIILLFTLVLSALNLNAQCTGCGDSMGSYNGVAAYKNCGTSVATVCGTSTNNVTNTNGITINSGPQWHCTEYVQRYYFLKYNLDLNPSFGNANTYWTNTNHTAVGLVKYANGGTTAPAPGDIIVSTYSTYGHVGIVTAVTSTQVTVIHQNWGNDVATKTLTRTGNNVGGFSANYTIAGWVRKSTSSPSCGAPTSAQVNASTITSTSAKLNCTVAGYAEYYWRYRQQGTSSWSSVSTTTTNYKNISGLLSGKVYEFQVAGKCSALCSNWSPTKTFTTLVNCNAPTTTQISATNITNTAARLNCTVSGVAQYDWQYRKQGTTAWTGVTATTTNYKSISGLLSNTTYEFQVAVICGSTWSNWSATRTFKTAAGLSANDGNDDGGIHTSGGLRSALMKTYPNPSSGQVTIDNLKENDQIHVFSSNGQIIFSARSQGTSINLDLSEFDNGTYVVRVSSGGEVFSTKMVLLK